MPRFFVDAVSGSEVLLTGDAAEHIRVLRLREGEEVTLCDGSGTDYQCRMASSSGGSVRLEVLERRPSVTEPAVAVSVYMAFAKADKLEHVIQKATELGAWEIVAYPSSRCVARYDAATLAKKLPRWQKIAQSAAEQSGRGRIPQVRAAESWAQALAEASQADLPLLFYEQERDNALHQLVGQRSWRTASILTGPEGGYSQEEAAEARAAGILSASLGTRILRCETAPLAALSALMYAAGEM